MGVATLTNLNPYVNAWYLLVARWDSEPPAGPPTTCKVLAGTRCASLRETQAACASRDESGMPCTIWTERRGQCAR